MSDMQSTPGMGQALERYLLSIRGTLAPPTLEAARKIYNETAGAPQNIAAARSLGDLSHMVYVPLGGEQMGADEFLIMDIWNSMDGLGQFFANKQVQEQGGMDLFRARAGGMGTGERLLYVQLSGSAR